MTLSYYQNKVHSMYRMHSPPTVCLKAVFPAVPFIEFSTTLYSPNIALQSSPLFLALFSVPIFTYVRNLQITTDIQGRGSLVGCRLWGHTESDTTEVT